MAESHRHNAEWKKPDTKNLIKFKDGQNLPTVIEV